MKLFLSLIIGSDLLAYILRDEFMILWHDISVLQILIQRITTITS